jgi:hypothetical protein
VRPNKSKKSCQSDTGQAPKGIAMKKTLAVILIIALGFSGFLYYDWHTKTKKQAAETNIPQYSWTDSQGAQHFTDRPPPKGATKIKETKGYKYIEPPLVITLKDKAIEYYNRIKEKISKSKKKKKRK